MNSELNENKKEEKNDQRKEYDGFVFLPSYRESYDCLVNAGEYELANLFLQAIVAYGTEGEIITRDNRIEIVMASIRRTIDAGRKNYKDKQKAKEIDDASKKALKVSGRYL